MKKLATKSEKQKKTLDFNYLKLQRIPSLRKAAGEENRLPETYGGKLSAFFASAPDLLRQESFVFLNNTSDAEIKQEKNGIKST